MAIWETQTVFHCQKIENLHKEFAPGFPEEEKPQLDKECAAIRTFQSIDEIFKFINFSDDGTVKLGENTIIKDSGDHFIVIEDNLEIARVSVRVNLPHFLWQVNPTQFVSY